MFTNARLFTIDKFTNARFDCTYIPSISGKATQQKSVWITSFLFAVLSFSMKSNGLSPYLVQSIRQSIWFSIGAKMTFKVFCFQGTHCSKWHQDRL